ncbi:GNAT family N-acetyltransferase [Xanthomonas arboricola]|uniref:GNAT family N-acetyltransferase n=1 Tax=Xanthomonas arboricola TaxID=56448 RepID=UPI000E0E5B3A|nr:GNAT family N-acetyltransferase [Xanthomonas arboricola]
MNLIVPLTKDLSGGVATLDVEDNQRDFIGAFESTLADVSERATGHVILNEGAPAGFFIIDFDYPTRYAFAAAGSVGLRSFFIASNYQGKGLARRALQNLSTYLQAQRVKASSVFLTVNCRNTAAASLYRKCGFVDNGELYLDGSRGPQHIMALPLT